MKPNSAPQGGPGSGRNKASAQGLGLSLRPKRHRKIQKDAILGIRKPAIRRIARRGGVKRIQQSIYETTREVIADRIREVMSRVVTIVEHCNRKVVTSVDIVYALKDMPGHSLNPVYGFEWPVKEFAEKRVRHTAAPTRDDSVGHILAEMEKENAMDAAVNAQREHDRPQTPEIDYVPSLSPSQSRTQSPEPSPYSVGPAWTNYPVKPFGNRAPAQLQTPPVSQERVVKTLIQRSPSPDSLSALRTAAWVSARAVGVVDDDHNDYESSIHNNGIKRDVDEPIYLSSIFYPPPPSAPPSASEREIDSDIDSDLSSIARAEIQTERDEAAEYDRQAFWYMFGQPAPKHGLDVE